MAACGFLQALGEAAAGYGGADQENGVFGCLAVGFREVEGFSGGCQRCAQAAGELDAVGGWGFLKVQDRAAVAAAAAFPEDRRAERFRVLDGGGLVVADAEQAAFGLQKQALAQERGVRSDAVGGVGQRAAESHGLLGGFRRGGDEDLQSGFLPLAAASKTVYTGLGRPPCFEF